MTVSSDRKKSSRPSPRQAGSLPPFVLICRRPVLSGKLLTIISNLPDSEDEYMISRPSGEMSPCC